MRRCTSDSLRRQRQSTHGLVVYDYEGTRETCVAALRLAGLNVCVVDSGTAAIQLAAGTPFDVILLDLGLRDISGIDVINAFGEHTRSATVLLSGSLSVGDAVQVMKLSVADVIQKPITNDRLLACVSEVIEQRRSSARLDAPCGAPRLYPAAARLGGTSLGALRAECLQG